MIEGRTSRDFHNIKSFCYQDPELFGQLMDLLVEATIAHLSAQLRLPKRCRFLRAMQECYPRKNSGHGF